MIGLNRLFFQFKIYSNQHKQLYAVSIMLFFFAIFDGIFSFITPLYITQKGISESMMGLIISTSSIAGILFDILLCRLLKDTRFRLIYLLMFLVCFSYPWILWQANSAVIFIIAMALWGLYYDLVNIGNLDFISRTSDKKEYSTSFAVLRIFFDLGYLIAPLMAGFLIYKIIDFRPFLAAWIFLLLGFISFILVLKVNPKNKSRIHPKHKIKTFSVFKELSLWKKIGNFILPVLLITLMINIIDATYWTIGPLLSSGFSFLGDLSGLFMMVYILPPLLVGFFVGKVTTKLGKKNTAFISLLIGSIFLSLFYFINIPIILVLLSFLSSFCISFAFPALNGAYADYINESADLEKEINTMQDSFTNLGYVIGPCLAGFGGQYLGHLATFSLLGLLGIVLSFILLKITPKQINIKINKNESAS